MTNVNGVSSKLLKFLLSDKGVEYLKSNPKYESIFDYIDANGLDDKTALSESESELIMSALSEIEPDADKSGDISGNEYSAFIKEFEQKLSDANISDTSTEATPSEAVSASSSQGGADADISVSSGSKSHSSASNSPKAGIEETFEDLLNPLMNDDRVEQARQKMEDAQKEYDDKFEASQEETESMDNKITDFETNIEKSNALIESCTAQIGTLNTQMGNLSSQLAGIESAIGSLSSSDDPEEQAAIDAQRAALEAQQAAVQGQIDDTQTQIDNLNTQILAETANIESYNAEIKNLNDEMNEMNEEVETLKTTYEEAKQNYEQVLADVQQHNQLQDMDFNPEQTPWDKNDIDKSVNDRLTSFGVNIGELSVSKNKDGSYSAKNKGNNYENEYQFDNDGKLLSYKSAIGTYYLENGKIYFEHPTASQGKVRDVIPAISMESIVIGSSDNTARFDVQELLAYEKNYVESNPEWNKSDQCVQYTSKVFSFFGVNMPIYSKDVNKNGLSVSGAKVRAGDVFLNKRHVGMIASVIPLTNGQFMYVTIDKDKFHTSVNIRSGSSLDNNTKCLKMA